MRDASEKTGDKEQNVTAKDILRFSLHYWKRTALPLTFSLFFLICAVILDTVKPVYIGKIFDALTSEKDIENAMENFGYFILLVFAHMTLWIIAEYLWVYRAARNLYSIVTELLYKVQRFSSDWHANSFAGGTVRKTTRGMWSFADFEDIIFFNLIPATIVLIGMTVMLSLTVPLMGLYAFFAMSGYVAFSIYSSVAILSPKFIASADKDSEIGSTLADIITGIPTVKSFASEKHEDNLFRKVADEWKIKSLNAWYSSTTVDLCRSIFRYCIIIGLMGIGIYLWSKGEASAGDVATALTAGLFIGGYLRDIGRQVATLQRKVSEIEDGVGFWLREDEVRDTPDAPDFIPSKGEIEFNNVEFSYKEQIDPVYKDFSLKINSGEKVALVGVSGSGKSTFVKLVQRLYDIQKGEILIDGQNIAKVTQETLRPNIALVPQDPILFHRSLAENISYGKKGASMDEIIEAAKKAHCHDFIEKLPLGYDTLVGERGIKLSGGERQRVAIARAILADAPILILDEATSSLDSLSEHYIQKALENLTEGKTTITIAHRLATIREVDRILVFENGKIVEQGSHKELLAREDSLYKRLYDMQSLGLVGDL